MIAMKSKQRTSAFSRTKGIAICSSQQTKTTRGDQINKILSIKMEFLKETSLLLKKAIIICWSRKPLI